MTTILKPSRQGSFFGALILALFGLAGCASPADSAPKPAWLAQAPDAVVAADGSGLYTTVQAAIDAAPANRTTPWVIHIRPGIYQGQILVPAAKPHLVFQGDSAEKTILTYAHNVNEPDPSAARGFNGTGVVIAGDDFCAENITLQNTSGDHGQALALRVNGDRAVFYHCRLLGWQDTLLLNSGRQYFRDCYIAGRVDFIYGAATAVFDRCEIHSKNGGHITAASTPQNQPFGFVFLDCKLTGDPAPWVNPADGSLANNTPRPPKADLGRPWRDYACVAYLRCELGDHIKPAGFGTWVGAEQREKTARYYEYKNTGPGAVTAERLPWTHQLTDAQAQTYTVQNVLKGSDGWNPWP